MVWFPVIESAACEPEVTDLADFLIEFSIGINKHAMYPGGHPSLRPAAERVVDRLTGLLIDRGTLSQLT